MNIQLNQLFWGSLGTRVLTHPHLNISSFPSSFDFFDIQVLEEYHEHEIQGILDVPMAPEPRAAEELPKLMRGETPH